MPARIAIQNHVSPNTVVARMMALRPSAMVMLAWEHFGPCGSVTHPGIRSALALLAFVLILLLSTLSSQLSRADDLRIAGILILERGIYEAHSHGTVSQSTIGAVHGLRQVKLLESTTRIPGVKSIRFGLLYVLLGGPKGTAVPLRLVTRFPDGGLLDVGTGIRYSKNEYVVNVAVDRPVYRHFNLDNDWEIVPGLWTFEFWYGDVKLGEQEFCVFSVVQFDNEPAPMNACSPLMG